MSKQITVSMQTASDSGLSDQFIYFNQPVEINATFTDFNKILTYTNKTHLLRYIDENEKESFWKFNDKVGNWKEIVGIGSGTSGGDGHMHDNIALLDSLQTLPGEEGKFIADVDADLNINWSKFIDEIPDLPDHTKKYYLTKTITDTLEWIEDDEFPVIDETFGAEPKVLMGSPDGTLSWAGDKIPSQSFIYDNGRSVMEFDIENPHNDLITYFSDETFTVDGEKFIIYTFSDFDTYDSEYDKIMLFINGFIYSGLLNESIDETYVYDINSHKLLIRIIDK